MADRFWVGGTGTWTAINTANWSASSGGASGASVPTAADSVFFDQAATYTVTMSNGSGALTCLDFTISAGTVTIAGAANGAFTISGSMSIVSNTVWNSLGVITFNSTTAATITTNGVLIKANGLTFNATGSWQLLDALTHNGVSGTTWTNGTLDLNSKVLTTTTFVSNVASTRTLAFGTGNITLTSSGTTNIVSTGLTITGTPQLIYTYAGATAVSCQTGAQSEATSISVKFTAGTYALSLFLSVAGHTAKNVDFTGFAGTWSATSTATIYGNLTLSTGMTLTASASAMTFGATSGTKTITTSEKTLDFPLTFNGVGGTWQLQDALTLGAAQATTLTNGTLDLNGKTLTTGLFASTNSNTRAIAFGTGNIICNAAGGTLWTTATATNLTVTGTPVVNISNSGAVATTVTPGQLTEAQAISFNFTAGTYTLTFLNTAGVSAKNVNFTGFSGTLAATSSGLIYGNLTLSTDMTLTASAGAMTFGATSGTRTITSNTKTIDFPITFNGVGGTWQLQDALTLGATRTLTLTNGTLDLNGKTLTTGLFSSSNSNTRTIAFGTGNIFCNAAGGTLWTTATVTNLTVTGTPVVNISNSGAVATTVTPGQPTEANSISFNFTSGAYALSFLNLSGAAKNVNFTGYAGTLAAISTAVIYGDLTIASGMTLTASANAMTFSATSGTKTITSNAKTIDFPITFNGVGGTWQLQDALAMGATRTLTHTNGTIDLNGKTLAVGTAYTTATGTKNLTFNGGTLVCPTAATTAFNNAVPTGYTTTAGTGTGKISMTAATAKTFVGGGSTYNCTLSNDGAGALTISGANTFTNIANGVQPTSFVFPIATTQTVTNWNVSGTAGNLVTITSGTAGTAATLSKASGTVSSNYLSLKDSTATGGATWYAGANSTNVSGNLGWIFTAPPATNTGNFFFMF